MKIKYIKFTFLILCIVFLTGFNYLSLAATTSTKTATMLDSDNDGLSDSEEALYGTDPHNPDTDGDGYSDGVEVRSGYNPLKPAPGDKVVVEKSTSLNKQNTTSELSLTDSFNNDFQAFIASKNGQSVSTTEVKTFIDTALASKITPTDISSIAIIDRSQLKIKSQNYNSLSASDKKQKLQQDAVDYLNQVVYLLISNSPTPIVNNDDLSAFQADFMGRLADFSSNDNFAYFTDLGRRLSIFSEKLNGVEVPETMVDLHLKFTRIINASLFLQNLSDSSNPNDPMGKIVTLNKIKDLIGLFNDFFTNDFQSYIKQIKTI